MLKFGVKPYYYERMEQNMKQIFLVLLTVLVVLLSACQKNSTNGNNDSVEEVKHKILPYEPKVGGTLTYHAYEPNHINPITYRQSGSIEILVKWVFQSLLDTDPVTGEDIPRIAKKWKIGKSGKDFTFWIDEKAKWADGKPITAEDVKFSFEVFSMPGIHSAFRKAQASGFSKIQIINPRTIKFTAKTRLFSNFEFLINTLILPKHLYYYKDSEKIARNKYTKLPQGSGPYIVKSWKKGDRCILVRNPNFWAKHLPQNKNAFNFDKIVIRYIRDAQIAFEKMKKGDLDYMPIRIGNSELWRQTKHEKPFRSGKILALKASSKIQQGYGFIGFNLKNDLFKDQFVRKALGKAVNRHEMIKKSLNGLANIPKGPLFSVDNFAGKFQTTKYDPAAALKDLASRGWKDSDGDYILDKNGKKFAFTVLVPNQRIEKEMLFVQDYWKQIGVEATIKIVEYSTWRQLQDERKFDAISNGKSRSRNARSVDPYGEWHSDNLPSGLRNYYGYSNKEVDKLIIKARQEYDQIKRKALLDKANDIIAEDYVMFQYSESKYSLHAVSSKIGLKVHEGKQWLPYDFGMKYWYKR
jgi:ABC-type transport system substrate-binding protein